MIHQIIFILFHIINITQCYPVGGSNDATVPVNNLVWNMLKQEIGPRSYVKLKNSANVDFDVKCFTQAKDKTETGLIRFSSTIKPGFMRKEEVISIETPNESSTYCLIVYPNGGAGFDLKPKVNYDIRNDGVYNVDDKTKKSKLIVRAKNIHI